jgi:hypothetical protein
VPFTVTLPDRGWDSCDGVRSTYGWDPAVADVLFSTPMKQEQVVGSVRAAVARLGLDLRSGRLRRYRVGVDPAAVPADRDDAALDVPGPGVVGHRGRRPAGPAPGRGLLTLLLEAICRLAEPLAVQLPVGS